MALNMEKMRQAKEELDKKRKERDERQGLFYRFKVGDNLIRILPIGDDFVLKVIRHRINNRFYICPKTFNKACPVCELIEEARLTGKIDEKIRDMMPRVRYYSVIVYKDDGEEKVGLVGYGETIYSNLLNYICDPEWGDFTDPDKGYALNIVRKGEGLETKYQVMPRPKRAVKQDKYKAWLSQMPDLSLIFRAPSYEDLVAILEGKEVEGSEEIEEEP